MSKELKSPLQTIREHCLECNGTPNEVKLCPVVKCKLYPYRFGTSPNRKKREMTEEQKEAAKLRLEKARRARKDRQ